MLKTTCIDSNRPIILKATRAGLISRCFVGRQTAMYLSIVITASSQADVSKDKYKTNSWILQDACERVLTSTCKQGSIFNLRHFYFSKGF